MSAPLTELQQRFAVEYAMNGGNVGAAARAAGYSPRSADDLGSRTLALPHVQEAILQELTRLRGRSGAIGWHAMISIAQNENAPAAARVSAARSLLEHAGMVGTAKDLDDARRRAEHPDSSKIVDYVAVLNALAAASPAPPAAEAA